MTAQKNNKLSECEIPLKFPFARRKLREVTFLKFFALGLEESLSPFLNPFARNLSKNLSFRSSIFAAILLMIAFSFHIILPAQSVDYIFLTLCLLIVAPSALIESIQDIIHGDINIDVLMVVASLGACLLGRGFEGALLLVLFAISGAMEDFVTLKAKKNLTGLEDLVPEKATLIDKSVLYEKAVVDINKGEIILIRHGEIVPLDGTVVEGEGALSLAHLTGESNPISTRIGSEVVSGGRLLEGSIKVLVDRTSSNSTLTRLVRLVTQAHETKPALTKTFEKFGKIYASTIMLASFLAAILLPLFGIPFMGDSGSVVRALSFLITASPCALVLAIPIAYISSLGLIAKKGIVVKGSHILDALVMCHSVAFDKTGTLTYGKLRLSSELPEDKLSLIASIERGSTHPIGTALVEEASSRAIPLLEVADFRSYPGRGVEGEVIVDGVRKKVFVLNVEEALVHTSLDDSAREDLLSQAKDARNNGFVTACAVIDGEGFLLRFDDILRPGIEELVDRLNVMGKELFMLTGDSEENAMKVATTIGIDNVEASLKPEDKLQRIKELSQMTGLIMVGDGVNDAPALARATVGVSMGTMSSATAREASDIILLQDSLDLLDWLLRQAIRTQYVVMQNLILALLVIVLASISALFGELALWQAVCLHEGGTVLVGLNGLRLLRDRS